MLHTYNIFIRQVHGVVTLNQVSYSTKQHE